MALFDFSTFRILFLPLDLRFELCTFLEKLYFSTFLLFEFRSGLGLTFRTPTLQVFEPPDHFSTFPLFYFSSSVLALGPLFEAQLFNFSSPGFTFLLFEPPGFNFSTFRGPGPVFRLFGARGHFSNFSKPGATFPTFRAPGATFQLFDARGQFSDFSGPGATFPIFRGPALLF